MTIVWLTQRLSTRHTHLEPSTLNVWICRTLLGKGGKFQRDVRPRRVENEVHVTERLSFAASQSSVWLEGNTLV